MNIESYYQAKRLSFYIAHLYGFGSESGDIVHDAYVKWFDKTGKDLFDEHPSLAKRVVRNLCLNRSRNKNHYMSNGVSSYRRYFTISSTDVIDPESQHKSVTLSYTPTDELIYKDMLEKLKQSLTNREKDVLAEVVKGYNSVEISQQLGICQQRASIITVNIKKKLKQVL